MSEDLLVSTEDGVVVVRLSRPEKVNALTKGLLASLAAMIRNVGHAKGVILTGEGGNFSSGFDLDELTGTSEDDEIDDLLAGIDRAIDETPVPVVAAVEGACVGAGCDLAVSSDLLVAGESAFFSVPAIRLGVLYRTAAVREVVRRAGPQAAALLFLFGERISASAARECGLVAEVLPDGGAIARARALLDGSAQGVPQAVAGTKNLLRALRSGEGHATTLDEHGRSLTASPERVRAIEDARRRRDAQR